MNVQDVQLITASIRPADANLKVTWRKREKKSLPYHIHRGTIVDISTSIRSALRQLVKRVRAAGCNECGAQLRAVAKHGNDLYKALFDPVGGDTNTPRKVTRWLRELSGKHRIHFEVDDLVHVPWGLIYDADPEQLSDAPDKCEAEVYKNFWCVKHMLSCAYSTMPPELGEESIDAESFAVLPVFQQSVFDVASKQLRYAAETKALKRFFLDQGPAFTRRDVMKRWQEINDKHGLVYFLCHADGQNLALDAQEMITVRDFRLEFRRKSERDTTACLVFLNGCETATGHQHGGFLEATGRPGFYGFIGTEANVPNVFALRFGIDFMHTFFTTGKPVYSVMSDLRRRHWPLGLLYSAYCYSDLRLQSNGEQEGFVGLPATNFSCEPIGSEQDDI